VGYVGTLRVQVFNATGSCKGNARPDFPVQWSPTSSLVSCGKMYQKK